MCWPYNVPAVLFAAVNIEVPENGQLCAEIAAPEMVVTSPSAHVPAVIGYTPTVK